MSSINEEEVVSEGVSGLTLPIGRRVVLEGRGRSFVRVVDGPTEDAPTVVLLHGWFASGGLNWYNAFESLSQHFRIIAPDLRGHGRGIRSRRRFTIKDCAADVAALCRELGVEKAIFVGYSMGGPVAQMVWKNHRDLVGGLVFCATGSSFIPGLQSRMMFGGVMAVAAGTTRTTQMMTRLPRPIRSRIPKGLRGSSSRPSSMQVWGAQEMRRHNYRLVLEAGTAISTFNSRKWIGGVDVPTAVVVTTKDRAIPPGEQLQLALAIPHSIIHRYEEGHTSPVLESFGPAITAGALSVTEGPSLRAVRKARQ